jgi:hypothetical protein
MAFQKYGAYDRVSFPYCKPGDVLMSQNGLSFVFLTLLVIGGVFLLQWIWRRPLPKGVVLDVTSDSRECEVTPRPLMTPEEATLFNLIRLVAQDHLLVSVKLPILQVVSVVDKDEEARKALMRTIQPVRLDIVLAHPGTLQATTVVKFQKNEQEQPEKRAHVVDTVLKAAGINVVLLYLNRVYSVEHMTTLLGLAEEE